MRLALLAAVAILATGGTTGAQFLETFDDPEVRVDSSGLKGWSYFAGDGVAVIDLEGTEHGFASVLVDATRDRKNIWWAVIRHRVSERMDLEQLSRSGWELRVEARLRSSHAPRRVNLHVNTQRTTDFHSHLMEYEIPEADTWRTISMTTRDFPVEPGDTVFAQLALMDWGFDIYRVDIDYLKVDVVKTAATGPDLGEPLPYHPSIPDAGAFSHRISAAESAVIDVAGFGDAPGRGPVTERKTGSGVLTVSGSTWVISRWDLESFAGRKIEGRGLLELTTHSVQLNSEAPGYPCLVRVVEMLGGDPAWTRDSVTVSSLLAGGKLEDVFNPQMIIDWPVTDGMGGKTWFTIPRPVLQRLLDGQTRGLAIIPLGPVVASFRSDAPAAPRLLFNTTNEKR